MWSGQVWIQDELSPNDLLFSGCPYQCVVLHCLMFSEGCVFPHGPAQAWIQNELSPKKYCSPDVRPNAFFTFDVFESGVFPHVARPSLDPERTQSGNPERHEMACPHVTYVIM